MVGDESTTLVPHAPLCRLLVLWDCWGGEVAWPQKPGRTARRQAVAAGGRDTRRQGRDGANAARRRARNELLGLAVSEPGIRAAAQAFRHRSRGRAVPARSVAGFDANDRMTRRRKSRLHGGSVASRFQRANVPEPSSLSGAPIMFGELARHRRPRGVRRALLPHAKSSDIRAGALRRTKSRGAVPLRFVGKLAAALGAGAIEAGHLDLSSCVLAVKTGPNARSRECGFQITNPGYRRERS